MVSVVGEEGVAGVGEEGVAGVGEEGVAGVGDEGAIGVEEAGVGKEGEAGVSDVPVELSEEGVSVRGKVGVTKETTDVVGLCSVEEEGRIVGDVFLQDTKLQPAKTAMPTQRKDRNLLFIILHLQDHKKIKLHFQIS